MYVFRQLVFRYMRFFARLYLWRTSPKVIAVTGSVGKTSMKDAIACALGAKYRVAKSPRTYNADLGVPLAVLGLDTGYRSPWRWAINVLLAPIKALTRKKVDYLVLEMGIGEMGDMDRNLSVARPFMGVLGAVGDTPVHQEFFPSAEAVMREKAKVLEATMPEGYVFVYADDPMLAHATTRVACPVTRFGYASDAAVRASNYEITYTHGHMGNVVSGISCRVDMGGESATLHLEGAIGKHHTYPMLAAAAVATACGVALPDAARAILSYAPPAGRMRVLQGKSGATLLDDSYNASPIAVYAAIQAVREMNVIRKILFLGDMLELGSTSVNIHEAIGEEVAHVFDRAIFVGSFARAYARGAERGGMQQSRIHIQETSRDTAKNAPSLIQDGDLVLIKGSQGIRMEFITEALLANPNDRDKLTRQDWYWRRKN